MLLLALAGCHRIAAVSGTQVRMDFTRAGGLYSAPFPSDDLLRADGSVALDGFPNRARIDLVSRSLALLAQSRSGFATTGAAFLQLDGPLPTPLAALSTPAVPGPVFLLDVARGVTVPAEIAFESDGGPFGGANLISVLPLQGFPLRPRSLYAAVVLRSAGSLGVSYEMAQLAAGERPPALPLDAFRIYQAALSALRTLDISAGQVAGLAAFTTGAPASELREYLQDALARPLPAPGAPLVHAELFNDYCVYTGTLSMPDYQRGEAPYSSSGGGWTRDAGGRPLLQRLNPSHLVVTVPRSPMPPSGFPTAVFVRTGGGGDRPLVDRGQHAVAHGPAITPGSGPALEFARVGWAGVSVDGPLGGLRNPGNADEQFLIFNVANPEALRDNVRESALELALLPQVLAQLQVDAGECGQPAARFDVKAIMGHSMGATIAPLAVAAAPAAYPALVLSGAGGSWIENVLYKEKPVEVRPLAELLLNYGDRKLTSHDPVLTLLQWAAEPADPQVYAPQITAHVLMMQGIVDHYILPRIANALSIPLGLTLAGPELDAEVPGQQPLSDLLQLTGRATVSLPTAASVVTQHREDGIEDGHEVVFQTGAPKAEYRCFLASVARGSPQACAQ